MDWNSPLMKKVKFVLLGLAGLVALAFGAREMGTGLVQQSEAGLEAQQSAGTPISSLISPTVQ